MHQAELKVNLFLQEALAGRATVTEEVSDKFASDEKKQYSSNFLGHLEMLFVYV